MPELTIEVGDDGAIGKLPEQLQRFLDKRIDEAFKKGAEKTEKALNPHLTDPVELERLRQRAKVAEDLELKEIERDKRYDEALQLRDKANAEKIAAEQAKTQKAIGRVKQAVGSQIRAAAMANGARAESLDELERLLGADVDLDDDLTVFVRDAEGKPKLNAEGERVSIEGLVADYLKSKPHHVAASPGQGGGARGGATLSGRPLVTDDRSRVLAEIADRPTVANVAKGFANLGKRAS
jgi:hypothetical protein